MMDIDDESLLTEWQAQGLPTPTIQTINKHNNKAHLVWLLEVPVWKEHKHVVAYYKAIVNSIKILIKADQAYQNHFTKNFLNTDMYRVTYNDVAYELDDFRDFIISDSQEKYHQQDYEYEKVGNLIAGSRHIHLFEVLRKYAYKIVWEPNFKQCLSKKAEEINGNFETPIKVKYIVKSIYNFCWENREKFKPQKNRHVMGFKKIKNLPAQEFKQELTSRQRQSANRTSTIKNINKVKVIKTAIEYLKRKKIPITLKNIAKHTGKSLRTMQRSIKIIEALLVEDSCDTRSIRLIPQEYCLLAKRSDYGTILEKLVNTS